jgi:ASC-1-like (ASCH) protein
MLKLKVKQKYYEMLKSTKKTIELRLYDEKRRQIKLGDVIEFRCVEDEDDKFLAEVVKLHFAEDFAHLCQKIECQKAGFTSDEALINALEEFYAKERQKEFGVVGIEIRKV